MTVERGVAIARALISAIRQVRHYGPNHPAAREAVARFGVLVQSELLQMRPLHLEAGQQWLRIQSAPLPPEDQVTDQLRAHLLARRVQSLEISPAAGEAGIAALVRLLAMEPEELITEGGLEDALRSAGARGITTGMAVTAPLTVAEPDSYTLGVEIVAAITMEVERGDPVDVARARLAAERLIDSLQSDWRRLWPEVASRSHDELDPAHAINACVLSVLVAQRLDLPHDLHLDIGVAALLHDIGLFVLPWPLRVAERTIEPVRADWRHPAEGAFLLRHTGGRESLPMIVAAEHHLAASGDGSVLPHSRLVSLADYVDAVSCGRVPGQRQASLGDALARLLAGEGPRFDPVHVNALAAVLHRVA